MIEPNIIWVETLTGDYVNISTINRIYFNRTSQGRLLCIIMQTKDEMVHELMEIPDEGKVVMMKEGSYTFQSDHAQMLAQACATVISEWGRNIISCDHLDDMAWKEVEREIMSNLKPKQEVADENSCE